MTDQQMTTIENTQNETATADSDTNSSDQSPEGQSTAAVVPAAKQTLISRIRQFFRPRNGSTLREEIADALADGVADMDSLSASEKAMLHNILRLRDLVLRTQ